MTIIGRDTGNTVLVAGAAVAHLDAAAREVSATCWSSSRDINARAFDAVSVALELTERDRATLPDRAAADPGAIYASFVHALGEGPTASRVIDQVAADVDRLTRLLFYRSSAAHQDNAGITPSTEAPVEVIIPFRSRPETPLRATNLRAVVESLSHQGLPRGSYRITVVEESTTTAIPPDVLELIDRHIQIPYDGTFNKALALNSGTRDAPPEAILCFLDGDIALDDTFLARNAGRVTARPDAAHLPYGDMFCLRASDSHRVRSGEQATDAARDGYVLTHPPGGCVLLTGRQFQAVGPFDDRFLGWGGEDREFIDRAEQVGPVLRHPELLIHLYHERPAMRESRAEIMSCIAPRKKEIAT
jgi:hypothetical protein